MPNQNQAMDELLEAYSALLTTRRELVELLAANEGRPVTRDDI